jgi:hypothetical protein
MSAPLPSKVGSVSTDPSVHQQHQLNSIAASSAANAAIQLSSSCVTLHPTQSNTFSWPQNSSLQFVSTASQSCSSGSNASTTFSLIPQQLLQVPATTMLQMPNGTLGTQMLMTQNRPSTPASVAGFATSASNAICSMAGTANTSSTASAPIVQIIQTPNGPAQILSTAVPPLTASPLGQPKSSASPGLALNSSTNGSSMTTNYNSRTSKQILPKLSSKNLSISSSNATMSSTITTSNTRKCLF